MVNVTLDWVRRKGVLNRYFLDKGRIYIVNTVLFNLSHNVFNVLQVQVVNGYVVNVTLDWVCRKRVLNIYFLDKGSIYSQHCAKDNF